MKKDRNCGANVAVGPAYPTYPMMGGPAMPGIMPGIPNVMPMPTMPSYNYATSTGNNDYSNVEGQINNLNSQITRLENMVNNSSTSYNTKYNASNYQMM